ncbi:hypothetical protein [Pandoraea communis]|uniref:Uncharacterized protein n=1 Tax=Pandoraea communis TaxID=2508297 RepID=A0A5E4TW58_9BURK|nr:hypothetical protein [Pandoraea communis]MDM8355212.1 hypothetical protein [Pandoraea communis]VVD90958.1 hypothetical protein PCO31111_01623 [Pandoraea communis]
MDTTGMALRTMAFIACVLSASAVQAQAAYPPPALEVSVAVGQKIAIWIQPNYSVLCRSLGQPTFQLDSTPTLGEVLPEWVDYTVPDGRRCETMRFPGLIVWYQAGQIPGKDVVVWTVGFPRELTSRVPSSGEHRVTTTIVVR